MSFNNVSTSFERVPVINISKWTVCHISVKNTGFIFEGEGVKGKFT